MFSFKFQNISFLNKGGSLITGESLTTVFCYYRSLLLSGPKSDKLRGCPSYKATFSLQKRCSDKGGILYFRQEWLISHLSKRYSILLFLSFILLQTLPLCLFLSVSINILIKLHIYPENQTTWVAWVAEWVQLITSDNKPKITDVRLLLIDFWCLTPLSAIFQLYQWRPVLVVEETGVPGENHRPWASNW